MTLVPEDGRLRCKTAGGPLPPDLRRGLVEHRDQLVAVLRLRDVHRAMGFSEADVIFIETALLSGKVNEVRIGCLPPSGPPS